MPRVMINGVVWCKAEDEILKAAVERYGENQWHLVASLLRGKTENQCKARWDAGLDPRIKNNEWNREEDEKLLYLRKLMPNKKHTIALIIGRPADQCTSRYYYLWNHQRPYLNVCPYGDIVYHSRYEAQRKADHVNAANCTTSFGSQRIAVNLETETATTLSQNREDNDLRMLPLARARLASKWSKKTRRFTREKQIAVIRRLKHRQRAIERLRNERNRTVNYSSESSSGERTHSSFYDSSTRHVADVVSRCLDRDLVDEHEKESEELPRAKRPRQNYISMESLENDELLRKRNKVLVVPLPQYSYQKLHAFHDVQCKQGFEYASYYNNIQRCEA